MAEVRKNKKIEKYDITDKLDSKVEKKKNVVKKETNKEEKKNTNNKQSLWVRFRIFCRNSLFYCLIRGIIFISLLINPIHFKTIPFIFVI